MEELNRSEESPKLQISKTVQAASAFMKLKNRKKEKEQKEAANGEISSPRTPGIVEKKLALGQK